MIAIDPATASGKRIEQPVPADASKSVGVIRHRCFEVNPKCSALRYSQAFDRAAVRRKEGPHDPKAQPGAALLTACREEQIKYVLPIAGRDTGPIVAYDQ